MQNNFTSLNGSIHSLFNQRFSFKHLAALVASVLVILCAVWLPYALFWQLDGLLSLQQAQILGSCMFYGGIASFIVVAVVTRFRLSRDWSLKRNVGLFSVLLLTTLVFSSLLSAPVVAALTPLPSDTGPNNSSAFKFSVPFTEYQWVVAQFRDGTYYAVNGSDWNIMTIVEPWQPVAPWAALAENKTALVEQVLSVTDPGKVLLNELSFDYALTVPENVTVVESLNGLTRSFINEANSQGSPITISVDTVQPDYYLAQDSADRYINSWSSTDASTIFKNVGANLPSDRPNKSMIKVIGEYTLTSYFNIPSNSTWDFTQAHLTLAPNSNTYMVRNVDGESYFDIIGGVWNANSQNQNPSIAYSTFRLVNAMNSSVKGVTIIDPQDSAINYAGETLTGNIVSENTIYNSYFGGYNSSAGINFNGQGALSNNIVSKNKVSNVFTGINFYVSSGCINEYNTIEGNVISTTSVQGINPSYNLADDSISRYNIVTGNQLLDCTYDGQHNAIMVGHGKGAAYGHLISNNVIQVVNGSGGGIKLHDDTFSNMVTGNVINGTLGSSILDTGIANTISDNTLINKNRPQYYRGINIQGNQTVFKNNHIHGSGVWIWKSAFDTKIENNIYTNAILCNNGTNTSVYEPSLSYGLERTYPYNGQIAVINSSDTGKHYLDLTTALDLASNVKIVSITVSVYKPSGLGEMEFFPNEGETGVSCSALNDLQTVNIVFGTQRLQYTQTTADVAYGLYCFGYTAITYPPSFTI